MNGIRNKERNQIGQLQGAELSSQSIRHKLSAYLQDKKMDNWTALLGNG